MRVVDHGWHRTCNVPSSDLAGAGPVTSSTFYHLLQRIAEAWSLGQLRRIEQRLAACEPDRRVRYLLGRLAARERELVSAS